MTGAAGVLEFFDQRAQRACALDLAARNRTVDAGQVLRHHASGADIEVADFGITHLAVGKADIFARSA